MRKKNRKKVLLVGCGRIGVGYGVKKLQEDSHAAVLSRIEGFELVLYDKNHHRASSVAELLGVQSLKNLEPKSLIEFTCAVICSPTHTHAEYLSKFLQAQTPLIVCEKPMCTSASELNSLQNLRRSSASRIVVNYSRRFQPSYSRLAKRIAAYVGREPLRAISVRYQRGFLNNASHALDAIQFLTGWPLSQAQVCASNGVNDEFKDDPTMSCLGEWNGAALSIIGLPNVRFSLFEIDLFFERRAVRLRDRGDLVEIATSARPAGYYSPLKTKTAARGNLKSPLDFLYRHTRRMMQNPRLSDNFDESVLLENWLLGVTRGKYSPKSSVQQKGV